MGTSNLKAPFIIPLNKTDTEQQTYGCRVNNTDIYSNNCLQYVCAFTSNDKICREPSRTWKKHLKLKGGKINE